MSTKILRSSNFKGMSLMEIAKQVQLNIKVQRHTLYFIIGWPEFRRHNFGSIKD